MPLNLIKVYNGLLELNGLNEHDRKTSLLGIFDRDVRDNDDFKFRAKQIIPTPLDGEIKMSTLFTHLTTRIIDYNTKKREFDHHRSIRLHWLKHHIDELIKENILVFSVKEPNGFRTYIFNKDENYVVVLEPLRRKDEYYLLTQYYVQGKDAKRKKFEKKYNKLRLKEVL